MAGILDYLKFFRFTCPYPNMKHETRGIQGTLASISAQGPSSATRSRYRYCFGKQLKSVASIIIPNAPNVWIIYLQVKHGHLNKAKCRYLFQPHGASGYSPLQNKYLEALQSPCSSSTLRDTYMSNEQQLYSI